MHVVHLFHDRNRFENDVYASESFSVSYDLSLFSYDLIRPSPSVLFVPPFITTLLLGLFDALMYTRNEGSGDDFVFSHLAGMTQPSTVVSNVLKKFWNLRKV